MIIKDFTPASNVYSGKAIAHAPLVPAHVSDIGNWTPLLFDTEKGTYIGNWTSGTSPILDITNGFFRFGINIWAEISSNIVLAPDATGWAALRLTPWDLANGVPGPAVIVAQAHFESGFATVNWDGEVFNSDTVELLINSNNIATDVTGSISCFSSGLGP